MISYFIPISLMVVAGFTLGLLVGRLAWGSPKTAAEREPADSLVPDEGQEAASGSALPSHSTTQDLPVWRMTEIGLRQGRPPSSSPVNGDPNGRPGGDSAVHRSRPGASGMALGGSSPGRLNQQLFTP